MNHLDIEFFTQEEKKEIASYDAVDQLCREDVHGELLALDAIN